MRATDSQSAGHRRIGYLAKVPAGVGLARPQREHDVVVGLRRPAIRLRGCAKDARASFAVHGAAALRGPCVLCRAPAVAVRGGLMAASSSAAQTRPLAASV